MSTKLSKRKLKALAFRGKTKSKPTDDDNEELKAVPIEQPEDSPLSTSWLGKDAVKGPANKRKRKREDEGHQEQTTGLTASAKSNSTTQRSPKKFKGETKPKAPSSKRFIVFVGNLPHLQPSELQPALQSHFPEPPKSIRIPTKKGTNAPQGFAFLEFDTASSLEKALRCHHTMFLKRKINVELTAGGGGKSASRMAKVKQKNEALAEERKQRVEEEKKNKTDEEKKMEDGIHPDRLKRIKGRK
jgi:nucleolar protein 6